MRCILSLGSRLVVLLSLLSLVWAKTPHIGLYLHIHSGHRDGPVTPVVGFSAPLALQDVVPVQLGALCLELPRAALSLEAKEGLREGILRTQFDGMYFWFFEPRAGGLPPLRDLLEPD